MSQSCDRWHRWLLDTRHGGDAAYRERMLTEVLYPVRDAVLDKAGLRPGETLLDVGAGDGLIAFAALDRLGPDGQVIFADISRDLLDHCRDAVLAQGLLDRCSFVRASAGDLAGIAAESVDVVTTRSVLIYVADKDAALREFHRVLRPGGRISLFEPINRLQREPGRFYGYDVRPVARLAGKVVAFYQSIQPPGDNPMLDFDDRDLVRQAEAAGFPEIDLELRFRVRAWKPPCPWEQFLRTSANPLIPTFGEAMDRALSPAEIAEFTAALRPLVEAGNGTERSVFAFLTAVKDRAGKEQAE